MSTARRAVEFAARLLPKEMRDRYREQWTSDLRDAVEAGISQGEIARGTLAFAATVARPLPWSGAPAPTAAQVESRSRFAAALALAAAVLGVLGIATAFRWAMTGYYFDRPSFIGFLVGWLLSVWSVLAPIAAVLIVMRTRAVNSKVRLAVWLLVLPGFAPIVQRAVDGVVFTIPGPGSLAYAVAAVIVVVALRLLRTGLQRGHGAEPVLKAHVYSALAVLVVGALSVGFAAQVWASRIPLVFSWLPAEVAYSGPNGTLIREEIPATQAMYEEWLWLKESFEQMVAASFIGVVAGVVVLAIAIVVLPRVLRVRPVALAGAVIGIELVATAMLLSLLSGGFVTSVVPPELLQTVGSILLVAAILYAVGGLRFDPNRLARVRHRHDVEGGVELL